MLKITELNGEEKYTADFIGLPKKLYSKKTITQNEKDERAVLSGMHILSGSFTVYPFLLYDGENASGRFIITLYPGDDNAYIGFFECIESQEYARAIFDYAKAFAAGHGKKKLIGPYDASFWIKYRLKTDNFDLPYTGEPYNMPYYYKMFCDNGFTVLKRYITNGYPRMPRSGSFRDEYIERYNACLKNGYTFKSPNSKNIDIMMAQCYQIISALYSDFPCYKPISEDEFMHLYSYLKYVADKKFMKMAYLNGEPVGFLICFPDYSNSLYKAKLTLLDYLTVIAKRIRSGKYIWLYMGVMPEHRGLGKALTNSILNEQIKKRASFLMALIKDDNVNNAYLPEIMESVNEYVLMECDL